MVLGEGEGMMAVMMKMFGILRNENDQSKNETEGVEQKVELVDRVLVLASPASKRSPSLGRMVRRIQAQVLHVDGFCGVLPLRQGQLAVGWQLLVTATTASIEQVSWLFFSFKIPHKLGRLQDTGDRGS